MDREELIKERNKLRERMNTINQQLSILKAEANKAYVGKYFHHIDSDRTEVWFSITGVDTQDNVRCDMIVRTLEDGMHNYSITKNGITEIGYLNNEITLGEFNVIKSVVIATVNTML